ncbi:response regulator transcription factor [uncultured Winogradskyella sp.]|uniref:response regulator transcription factor n=1 Tax=uncultured Winogradskyella sp. TaxID=395353 RepID=UPI00261E87ED|nr:response regulator transcription factor [uncultured Winogradskyella sp.]
MESKIKIVLADDELLFRQGLKSILESESNIEVLFDAENGSDLLKKLKKSKVQPDIVVTDLKMPELNGVEVTKIIRKEFPEIKMIALTSYFSKPFILNMISIGAVAYLAKNSTPKLMIKTIKEVYRKGFYYDKIVLKYIHESINGTKSKAIKSNFDTNYFSKRELQILGLICKQMTAKDIADKLCLSPRTVEGHRNSLLLKTNSKNVAGLVIYGLKNKLVDLDSDISLG